MPPVFMRGVVPVRTLVPGGARISGCVPSYVSFRTSAHAGVGISIVIVTAVLLKMEIATPVCGLVRNDREFDTAPVR